MSAPDLMGKKCGKRNRAGGTCGQWAMHGQNVCYIHGGKSPQALAKAEERMRDLIHPSITALARQIENDEFAATRYVLDWAGFKATEKIQQEGTVTVEIELVNHQPPRLNGATHAAHPTA